MRWRHSARLIKPFEIAFSRHEFFSRLKIKNKIICMVTAYIRRTTAKSLVADSLLFTVLAPLFLRHDTLFWSSFHRYFFPLSGTPQWIRNRLSSWRLQSLSCTITISQAFLFSFRHTIPFFPPSKPVDPHTAICQDPGLLHLNRSIWEKYWCSVYSCTIFRSQRQK